MSWLPASSLSLRWLLVQNLVLLSWVVESRSSYICSKAVYNSPVIQDCTHALAALPQADEYYRYYVEPQLETAPPEADWRGWVDERPFRFQRKVIQVPKFWSYGKHACLRTWNANRKVEFQTWSSYAEDDPQDRAISHLWVTSTFAPRRGPRFLGGQISTSQDILWCKHVSTFIRKVVLPRSMVSFQRHCCPLEALTSLCDMTQIFMAAQRSPCSFGKLGPPSTRRWTSTWQQHFPRALIPGTQQS